jgi:hypothetical protein
MADQVMRGSVELDALKPELWSAAFYPTLLEALPFNASVARDYEGEIRALGDIVNVTEFPQFDEAENIQEDQRVDADAVTALNIQLVINKQTVKDYIVTDRAKVQTIEHSNALRDLAFFSIMKKMQADIIADIVPSAAAPDHQISYDSGTTLALADLLEGKELLDGANVPDDGARTMITDAPQWNDLFNITGFTSRDFIPAGSPLTTGAIPAQILGFTPKYTTEASNVTYMFHPIFMQIAVQRELGVKEFDQGVEGKRSVRVNSTMLWGVKQFSDVRVVSIS